jgi:hypothetical protein
VQGHPADAELTRGLGDRQLQAIARISRKISPGWVGQRAGAAPTASSCGSVVLLEVERVGIATSLPLQGDPPGTFAVSRPAPGL